MGMRIIKFLTITKLLLLSFSLIPFPPATAGDRRSLHVPLVPIDWNTPPAQPLEPVLPGSPPPPATIPANPADIAPLVKQPRRASPAATSTIIGVAVSLTLLGVLSLSAFLLYRRLRRRSPESEKLVAGGHARRFEPSSASRPPAPDVLYLGTVAPAVGRDQVPGSPYRKLRESPVYQPSPELRPLPPLAPPPRRVDRPSTVLSDEDASFHTPNRSVESALSGSPSSIVSAKTISKDITVCPVDSQPKSRRSSPRSRLSNSSSSDVKRVVHQFVKPPPPPPPPPPPRSLGSKSNTVTEEIACKMPVLARPSSSRRQWVKPASLADVPVPAAEKPGVDLEEKPKLKPLHWDKVRATSDKTMVWDQLKSSSFQLDEDMFASLFCNSTNVVGKKEVVRRPVAVAQAVTGGRVLDPKKSQNIEILLRALNVTTGEVTEALLEGNPESLGAELLETLVKMAPTKEEELRLRDYVGDVSKLGSAERFLKAMIDVPFAFKRVDAMLYRANFDSEVDYLRKSFKTLESACAELKGSRLFLKLLEAILRAGNRMNVGTNRGEAIAFKLDTLLKLADVKGVDGKTTLLHFVVQEIIRSEGGSADHTMESNNSYKMKDEDFKKQGLKVVSGLGKELANVKQAAGMDSNVLGSYVTKLDSGLDKVTSLLQLRRVSTQGRFFESMKAFHEEAEEGIAFVKAEEKTTLALVKETTEYFHGNGAKEEAHPFRIFMVVRDFLLILDNVCREVERMQAAAVIGSARSFRMSTNTSLPVQSRFNAKRVESSDDDSSS